jgi:hypothetical protein
MQSSNALVLKVNSYDLLNSTLGDLNVLLKSNWNNIPDSLRQKIIDKVQQLQMVKELYPKDLEYLRNIHTQIKDLSRQDSQIDSFIIYLAREVDEKNNLIMNNPGFIMSGLVVRLNNK